MYKRSPEEICRLFQHRQLDRGMFYERMREISQHYNNQTVLPIPDVTADQRPCSRVSIKVPFRRGGLQGHSTSFAPCRSGL